MGKESRYQHACLPLRKREAYLKQVCWFGVCRSKSQMLWTKAWQPAAKPVCNNNRCPPSVQISHIKSNKWSSTQPPLCTLFSFCSLSQTAFYFPRAVITRSPTLQKMTLESIDYSNSLLTPLTVSYSWHWATAKFNFNAYFIVWSCNISSHDWRIALTPITFKGEYFSSTVFLFCF